MSRRRWTWKLSVADIIDALVSTKKRKTRVSDWELGGAGKGEGLGITFLAPRDQSGDNVKKIHSDGQLHQSWLIDWLIDSPLIMPFTRQYLNYVTVSAQVKQLFAQLFNSVRYNTNHVLHQLLPLYSLIHYNLRQRSHSLTLPLEDLIRKNFLHRMLFRDIY